MVKKLPRDYLTQENLYPFFNSDAKAFLEFYGKMCFGMRFEYVSA